MKKYKNKETLNKVIEHVIRHSRSGITKHDLKIETKKFLTGSQLNLLNAGSLNGIDFFYHAIDLIQSKTDLSIDRILFAYIIQTNKL